MVHFTMEELCRSQKAKARGINNVPGTEEKRNLEDLVRFILDPLREAFRAPIIVNSGFRCKELNKAVGGVPTSSHVSGRAADITSGTREGNKRLFELIQKLDLPYFELLDEKNYSWIHVSYNPAREPRLRHLK